MSVTAYWMDSNWVLNKILIVLHKMDGPHTANNIYRSLATVMHEYLLMKKILSIEFDNAATNIASINELQKLCQLTFSSTFIYI